MDFKPLATLSLLASLSLVTSQSFAATVNYDFTLTNTAAGTTVTGEIDGLTVGGTNISPSAVFITGYTLSTTIVSSFCCCPSKIGHVLRV